MKKWLFISMVLLGCQKAEVAETPEPEAEAPVEIPNAIMIQVEAPAELVLEAVAAGEQAELRRLLDEGAPIPQADWRQEPEKDALALAAQKGDLESYKLLLQRGVWVAEPGAFAAFVLEQGGKDVAEMLAWLAPLDGASAELRGKVAAVVGDTAVGDRSVETLLGLWGELEAEAARFESPESLAEFDAALKMCFSSSAPPCPPRHLLWAVAERAVKVKGGAEVEARLRGLLDWPATRDPAALALVRAYAGGEMGGETRAALQGALETLGIAKEAVQGALEAESEGL